MKISKTLALDNAAYLSQELLRSLGQGGTSPLTPSSGLNSLGSADEFGELLSTYASQGREVNSDRALLRTADTSLAAIEDLAGQLSELATESENEDLSQAERDSLQTQFVQLRDEVDRIAVQTKFAGDALLDDSGEADGFGLGSLSGTDGRIDFGNARSQALGFDDIDLSVAGSGADASAKIDLALKQLGSTRKQIGAADAKLLERSQSLYQAEVGILVGQDLTRQVSKVISSSTIVANQIQRQGRAAVALQGKLLRSLVQDLLG